MRALIPFPLAFALACSASAQEPLDPQLSACAAIVVEDPECVYEIALDWAGTGEDSKARIKLIANSIDFTFHPQWADRAGRPGQGLAMIDAMDDKIVQEIPTLDRELDRKLLMWMDAVPRVLYSHGLFRSGSAFIHRRRDPISQELAEFLSIADNVRHDPVTAYENWRAMIEAGPAEVDIKQTTAYSARPLSPFHLNTWFVMPLFGNLIRDGEIERAIRLHQALVVLDDEYKSGEVAHNLMRGAFRYSYSHLGTDNLKRFVDLIDNTDLEFEARLAISLERSASGAYEEAYLFIRDIPEAWEPIGRFGPDIATYRERRRQSYARDLIQQGNMSLAEEIISELAEDPEALAKFEASIVYRKLYDLDQAGDDEALRAYLAEPDVIRLATLSYSIPKLLVRLGMDDEARGFARQSANASQWSAWLDRAIDQRDNPRSYLDPMIENDLSTAVELLRFEREEDRAKSAMHLYLYAESARRMREAEQ